MSTAHADHVAHFYTAVADGSLTAALATLGESIEWHEAPGMPYRAERPYHGATEVANNVLGPINDDVEHLSLTVEQLHDLGRHVAVLGRYRGIARASRREIDQPFIHIWTLDDGGAALEFRQYTDTSHFTAALTP